MLAVILALEDDDQRREVEQWYNTYYKLMYKTAYESVKDVDIVEDLINEAFIRIIKNYEKVSVLNKYQQSYYHIKTIKSVISDYFRKNKKLKESFIEDEEVLDFLDYEIHNKTGANPEQISIDREGISLITRAMEKLSQRDALLIWARYYVGMTEGEVEKAFGIKARQVHVFLGRARKRLMKYIDEEENNGKN